MFTMRKYEMLGFFIISLISIAFALLFWILPDNFVTSGLGPTTDSLWQVGKLLFFSILFYAIAEYFIFGREFDNFVFAKASTLFVTPLLYIGLSYLLDTVVGNASFNNHIVTFVIALIIGQYTSYYILRNGYYFKLMNAYAIVGTLLMVTLYIGFGSQSDKFDGPIFKPMKQYQTHIKYLR